LLLLSQVLESVLISPVEAYIVARYFNTGAVFAVAAATTAAAAATPVTVGL